MKKITLNEWMQLPTEKRSEIKKEWRDNWNDWFYLLDEAVKAFEEEYMNSHVILNVYPAFHCEQDDSSGATITTEQWIDVSTSLGPGQYSKELPSEYAYFKVEQQPFGDVAQLYLKEWAILLKNLLGWPEEKTNTWVQEHHADDLEGKNWCFERERACYYVVSLLVPEDKKMSLLRFGVDKFINKVEMAIYYQNNDPLDPDYDWISARRRVNGVLKEIEASLP